MHIVKVFLCFRISFNIARVAAARHDESQTFSTPFSFHSCFFASQAFKLSMIFSIEAVFFCKKFLSALFLFIFKLSCFQRTDRLYKFLKFHCVFYLQFEYHLLKVTFLDVIFLFLLYVFSLFFIVAVSTDAASYKNSVEIDTGAVVHPLTLRHSRATTSALTIDASNFCSFLCVTDSSY